MWYQAVSALERKRKFENRSPIFTRMYRISHMSVLNLDVGNKSAVFPLQLLGFDVDVVNSVHFSNHTGYENGFRGDILKGDQLRDLLHGLEDNGLLSDIGHLLTGYIGSDSFLEAVLDVLKTLRKFGNVRFVCDPVLGDRGRFYVPESLVQLYREKVIPQADGEFSSMSSRVEKMECSLDEAILLVPFNSSYTQSI
jgi:pyridoxal kinase